MKFKKFLTISILASSVLTSSLSLAASTNQQTFLQPEMEVKQQMMQGNHENDIPFFETVQEGKSNSKKAIVFIGGANGTFHIWDNHIAQKNLPNVKIIGYEGIDGKGVSPHNHQYVEDNAKNIANGIRELKKQGFEEIDVIAMCLGGVVTKKAMLELDDAKELDTFKKVSFTVVSSPLGGFALAIPAQFTPLFKPISKFFNIAMSTDMSPLSKLYNDIARPLSNKVETMMIESKDDPLVQPGSSITYDKYEQVASTFKTRIVLDGGGVHDFAKNPQLLEKQGIKLTNSTDKFDSNNLNLPNKIRAGREIIDHKVSVIHETMQEMIDSKILPLANMSSLNNINSQVETYQQTDLTLNNQLQSNTEKIQTQGKLDKIISKEFIISSLFEKAKISRIDSLENKNKNII